MCILVCIFCMLMEQINTIIELIYIQSFQKVYKKCNSVISVQDFTLYYTLTNKSFYKSMKMFLYQVVNIQHLIFRFICGSWTTIINLFFVTKYLPFPDFSINKTILQMVSNIMSVFVHVKVDKYLDCFHFFSILNNWFYSYSHTNF